MVDIDMGFETERGLNLEEISPEEHERITYETFFCPMAPRCKTFDERMDGTNANKKGDCMDDTKYLVQGCYEPKD